MPRPRHIFLILSLVFTSLHLSAQESEIKVVIRGGHKAAFGGYGAISVEGFHTCKDYFDISGGAQYNSIGKTSAEARPAYFHDFSWGRLRAEALLTYTNLTAVNSIAAGAGVGISSRWIDIKAGYFYRIHAGRGGTIQEPFNIYYELCANLLPMIEDWDLQLFITNSEIFELERHYQPSFIAQCRYDLQNGVGISMGLGCKPAGIFNISADYYESYLKLGICYSW